MASSTISEFPLEEEYKKQTGIVPEDVVKLRDWLRTQPHLPEDHITDLDLILSYHCCNRSTELAKQVLDLNLTLKTHFTGLFSDRRFNEKLKTAMSTMLLTLLPTRSPEGYACYYVRAVDCDPKNFNFKHIARAAFMMVDIWQYEEGTWPGLMVVYDLEGLTLAHLAAVDLVSLQQYLYFGQEALLVKLKSLHFLNAPSFIDKLLVLIKPFLKKHIWDILHVHIIGSRTLDQFYPMDALPKDKTLLEYSDQSIEKVKNSENYFLKESKKRVDDSKRLGKPKIDTDTYGGILGSFKKLDID